jgi:hypothetical protein
MYSSTLSWPTVKVKVTLVQALRLCTGCTAHRGSRGIALLYHDHLHYKGWGVSVTPRPLFTPGKYPVPIVQEVGCAPGPVWTGAKNLALTGIRSPDLPARSQSLYRLRHPGPHICIRGAHTSKKSINLFKYFGTPTVTLGKCHTKDPHILGPTGKIWFRVLGAIWRQGFVYPWLVSFFL